MILTLLTSPRRMQQTLRLPNLGDVCFGVSLLAVAAVVGVVATRDSGRGVALGVALAPLLVLLVGQPSRPLLLGVSVIPFSFNMLGSGSPVRLSPSDGLLVLATLGLLLSRRFSVGRALRPLIPLLALYAAMLLLDLAAHPDQEALVNSVQRLQLTSLSLLVGVFIVKLEMQRRALFGFVAGACVLSFLWAAAALPVSLEFQKNPVGQFATDGLLIALALRGGRARVAAVPLLMVGLLTTASRGAILALVVGVVVLLVAKPGMTRLRTVAYVLPAALVFFTVYSALPDDVKARTSTFSASAANDGVSAEGASTIVIRQQYRIDAQRIIRQHPLRGVGVGNYLAGEEDLGTRTSDPHNFLLLEAAEGGLPTAAALVALLVGSGVLMWRRRSDTELAPVALAMQAGLLTHGLVDVYWVRGTPVVGWVLVGAALAATSGRQTEVSAEYGRPLATHA